MRPIAWSWVIPVILIAGTRADVLSAKVLYVGSQSPEGWATIQAAIDAANDGDTILIQPGTYTGLGNRHLTLGGKAITIRSVSGPDVTVVDCEGADYGLYIKESKNGRTELAGLTIRNAIRGGIRCYGSVLIRSLATGEPGGREPAAASGPSNHNAIIINRCIIEDSDDGGILIDCHENVTIAQCIIRRNETAGIWSYMSFPTVHNCVIVQNEGHGIHLTGGEVVHCTIADNAGAGLWADQAVMANSIIRDNARDQIYSPRGGITVGYSDVLNDFPGRGNIDADPCFADVAGGDYHLRSQAGRWDPNSLTWARDAVTSLCIDRGDPESDWSMELWPHGARVNMGAYGGTSQASLSLSDTGNRADLNADGAVDFSDFAILGRCWRDTSAPMTSDLDRNGGVNCGDLAVLADSWVREVKDAGPSTEGTGN